jgi:anti-sigma factor RsiW
MTDQLDDAILAAYVDGELSSDQLAEVEKALIHDPQARRKVTRMREVKALLRSTCAEENYQDVPDRLLRSLRPKRQSGKRVPVWLRQATAAVFLLSAYAGVDHLIHSRWDYHSVSTEDRQNAMLDEIAEYHAIYARETEHLAEVPADRKDHIEEWLGDRLSRKFPVPDLSSIGLTFAGARLLGIARQPVAQLLYTPAHGVPIALCVTFGDAAETALEVSHREGMSVGFWKEHGYVYVVVGEIPEQRLREVAGTVAPRMEPQVTQNPAPT